MNLKSLTTQVVQVSQNYAENFKIERTQDWFLLKLQEEVGELTQSYLMMRGQARTKGQSEAELQANFHKEVADVFCHVLLLAEHNNVDLELEVQNKWLSRLT